MAVSYDDFTSVFLDKTDSYSFLCYDKSEKNEIVDGYMARACSQFRDVCLYDLMARDDESRMLLVEIPQEDLIEIIDIVTDGMIVQWLKPILNKQENYENILNTRDFSAFSPERILARVLEAYKSARKEFKGRIKEYSYTHGDLTDLHL